MNENYFNSTQHHANRKKILMMQMCIIKNFRFVWKCSQINSKTGQFFSCFSFFFGFFFFPQTDFTFFLVKRGFKQVGFGWSEPNNFFGFEGVSSFPTITKFLDKSFIFRKPRKIHSESTSLPPTTKKPTDFRFPTGFLANFPSAFRNCFQLKLSVFFSQENQIKSCSSQSPHFRDQFKFVVALFVFFSSPPTFPKHMMHICIIKKKV